MIKFLAKFMKETSHAEMLQKGQLFMRPSAYYMPLESEKEGQADALEGAVSFTIPIRKGRNFPIFCLYAIDEADIDSNGIAHINTKCVYDFDCQNGFLLLLNYSEFTNKLDKKSEGIDTDYAYEYGEVTYTNTIDKNSFTSYVAVIGDVRILAEQYKKVQRKRIVTAEYSSDNDLDVYNLSAQLSVISKNNLQSIGEVEGQIKRLKDFYDKQRGEINDLIEEHNRLVSLWEQAQEFYTLSKKSELSDKEQLRKVVCKQAMERNEVFNAADADDLRERVKSLGNRIGGMKESLEICRQQYEVYCDIRDTYYKISKGDYLSNLVEEERKRREQVKKKTKSR